MKLNHLNLIVEAYGDPVTYDRAMSALQQVIKYIGGKRDRYVKDESLPGREKYITIHGEAVNLLQSIYDAMLGGTEEDMRRANSIIERAMPARSWEPMGPVANVPSDTVRYLAQFK